MATLMPDRHAVSNSDQRATGIEHDLLEVLQSDKGVAGHLEVVVDEGHTSENSSG